MGISPHRQNYRLIVKEALILLNGGSMNQHIKEAYLEQISAQFKISGHWAEKTNTNPQEANSISYRPNSTTTNDRRNTNNVSWFDINSLIDVILVHR